MASRCVAKEKNEDTSQNLHFSWTVVHGPDLLEFFLELSNFLDEKMSGGDRG